MDLQRFRLPGFEHRFSRQTPNKALLVILEPPFKPNSFQDDSLEEMKELARAAEIKVLGVLTGRIQHPSPSHYVREGKLAEARDKAKELGANVIIFNVDLTPGQGSNIEAFAKTTVIDRTGLILEIFGKRAKTKEGKLQVELAQLNYAMPRIGGLGTVMTRAGGGIGARGGGGEQELERDRRKIRLRIQRVKKDIEDVKKHRDLIRSGRKRKNLISAAIVGYTNAGKSTLLNSLTGSSAHVENKMFATLDPVARVESRNGRRDILFVDTVGFLRDLPHTLVKAFHATLEEVLEADFLIHVLDISNPQCRFLKTEVEKVLKELGAEKKPQILALNKADLLDEAQRRDFEQMWPEGILISAKEKKGMSSLLAAINRMAEVTNPPFKISEKSGQADI